MNENTLKFIVIGVATVAISALTVFGITRIVKAGADEKKQELVATDTKKIDNGGKK